MTDGLNKQGPPGKAARSNYQSKSTDVSIAINLLSGCIPALRKVANPVNATITPVKTPVCFQDEHSSGNRFVIFQLNDITRHRSFIPPGMNGQGSSYCRSL
jgi:hypothetical protein